MTEHAQTVVPVTVVAGFLGAGKTTLVNRILSADHGLRVAVMVNDFGALDIDAELIVGIEENVMSLANGCICCSVQSDFVAQLDRLLRRTVPPEMVLVESSGISDPTRIVHGLRYPQLRDRVQVDSVITVLDAHNLPELEGDNRHLAHAQLDAADIVILNKTDLVSEDELQALEKDWLYPGVRVIRSAFGEVPLELVLGAGLYNAERIAETTPAHAAHFSTWSWRSGQPLPRARLERMLKALPPEIYRVKGFLNLQELSGRRAVLQMVGSRIDLTPGDDWGREEPESRLVLIGNGAAINEAWIAGMLEEG